MTDGDQNQVSVFGAAMSTTFLLIHGSTVTRRMWQPQVTALAEESRIITLDLPGHGENAAQPFTMGRAVTQIEAVLTRYTTCPVVVVGISLGGYVAIAHAARYPERIAGLVLASTTTSFTGLLGTYVRVVGWLLGQMLDETFQRVRLTESIRRKYAPPIAEQLIVAGLYPRAAGQALQALAGFDVLARLTMLDCPILFVNGANDKASRKGETAFLAATRHGELTILPDAGHLCSLEQPERFTNAVRQFGQAVSIPSIQADSFSLETHTALHPPLCSSPHEPARRLFDMPPRGASP